MEKRPMKGPIKLHYFILCIHDIIMFQASQDDLAILSRLV